MAQPHTFMTLGLIGKPVCLGVKSGLSFFGLGNSGYGTSLQAGYVEC